MTLRNASLEYVHTTFHSMYLSHNRRHYIRCGTIRKMRSFNCLGAVKFANKSEIAEKMVDIKEIHGAPLLPALL